MKHRRQIHWTQVWLPSSLRQWSHAILSRMRKIYG
jgi:hypothetical protein